MGSEFLVRHATTDGSVAGRNVGRRSNPPLTSTGERLAERLGRTIEEELAEIGAGRVRLVSSPLRRCAQTAAAIRAGLARMSAVVGEPEVEPALVEIDYGDWEGLTAGECRARDPGVRAAWEADPFATACPGGESGADVAARAFPALDALDGWLAAEPERAMVVVTHNHIVRLRVASLLGLPMAGYRDRLSADPGGYTLVAFGGAIPLVRRVNARPDSGHG